MVRGGFAEPLHLVGVTGTIIDCHKPGHTEHTPKVSLRCGTWSEDKEVILGVPGSSPDLSGIPLRL